MKRIAMIQNGIVQNIAVWDGITPWNPVGYELVDVTDIECGPDYRYLDGVFSPPEIIENES